MNPRAVLADALLITLATPQSWPLALAAFLLRGGLLLVLLPIVVLPSPVSLGNVLGPALTEVVLSGVPVELAVVVGLVALGAVAWIVVGGLVAGSLEAEGARLVAHDDATGSGAVDPAAHPGAADDDARAEIVAMRVLGARLVAHGPTALALIWGSTRLVTVAYRELTSPSDVVSPIVLRVLRGAPEVILTVGVLWLIGEIVGGLAARRIVLADADARRGLRDALATALRHPVAVLAAFVVPAVGLLVILVPAAAAASAMWSAVRVAMSSAAGPFGATLAVVLFVGLWMLGLLLIAVTTAWRAAVWSVVERDRPQRDNPAVVATTG
jgi:hypothetical protein